MDLSPRSFSETERKNMGENVSESRESGRSLKDERDFYRKFIETLADWVWEMDLDGVHTYSNSAVETILGYSVDEVVGSSTTNLWFDEEKTQENLEFLKKSLASGKGWKNFHCTFRHKNGSPIFLESTAIPIFGPDDRLVGYRGVDRDITERKRSEISIYRKDLILEAVGFAVEQIMKTSSWKETAREALERLGKALEVSRVYIFKNRTEPDGTLVTNQEYEWVAEGVTAMMDSPDVHDFPYVEGGMGRWVELMSRGEAVSGLVKGFPASEQDILGSQDIRSILAMPIFAGKEWWGFVGFDDCTTGREWFPDEVEALKTAATIFGAGILRKRAEEELARERSRLANVIELNPYSIAIYDPEGRYIKGNKAHLSLFQAPPPSPDYSIFEDPIIGKGYAEELEWLREGRIVEFPKIWYNLHDIMPDMPDRSMLVRGVGFPIVDKSGKLEHIVVMHEDITEQKKAEEALEKSERKYKTIFGNIQSIYSEVTPEGMIQELSPSVEHILHYTREELLGRPVEALYAYPEERTKLVEHILKNGTVKDHEIILKDRDGNDVVGSFTGTLMVGEKETPVKIIGSFQDITRRKRAQDALRESEERFREVLENSRDALYKRDLRTGHYDYMSPAIVKIAGYSSEEVMAMDSEDIDGLVHPDDVKRINEVRKEILRGITKADQATPIEYRIRCKDGNYRWVSDHFTLLKGQEGNFIYSIASVRDITERKKVEEALRESEEKYRNLVERANDGITIIQDRIIKYANSRLTEMLGFGRDELIDKAFPMLLHPDELQKFAERYERRMAGESVVSVYEARIKRKDGSYLTVELNAGLVNYEGKTADLVIVRDITERKKTAEALEKSEEKHRSLFQGVPVGLYRTGPNGAKLDANPAFARILGYPDVESYLKTSVDEEYVNPDDYERWKELLEKDDVLTDFEVRQRRTDGEIIWVRESARVVRDEQGKVLYYEGSVQDITARKKVEEALHQSEQRLKRAQEIGRIGDWEFDIESQQIRWSDQVFELYERDLSQGPPTVEEEAAYYTPEVQKRLRKYAHQAIRKGKSFEYDFGVDLPSGKTAFMAGFMNPIRDEHGKVVKLAGTVQDITERKKAEEALREEHSFRAGIIKRAAEGLSVCHEIPEHPYVNFTVWNDRMTEITGYTMDEINEQGWYQSLYPDPETQKRAIERMERMRDGADLQAEEWTITRSDGEERVLTISTSIIETENGAVHVMALMNDITDRKRTEEELRDKNKQLEVANKLKSEFVGIVSHDFGNPLGIILGSVELMMMGAYGEIIPKMKEKLLLIQETANQLNKLRLDTLDLTRIDLGKLKITKKEGNLSRFLYKSVEGIKLLADTREQSIRVQCPENAMVEYDTTRIFQVIENYVTNAIRYTPEGGTIEVKLEESDEEVVIQVKDTGRGVAPEELENIFLPFYRTGERVKSSTGLGLSIAKGIVEAHGGRCWAESEGEGKGSTFSFTLPKE